MAKPAHHKVTFSGIIGTTSAPIEQWSLSFNLGDNAVVNAFSALQLNAYAASALNVWQTWLKAKMQSSTVLTEVRWACIGADGIHVRKRPDGSYIQGIWTGADAGQAAAMAMPLEVAMVATLDTSRAGATGRGRVFLPYPGTVPIDTLTKRSDDALTGAIATAVSGLIHDLNTMGDNKVSVVSSKGYLTPVNQVRVGRVPDVLRSRRRDQPEGYKIVAVT